jgi:hypothetical protein
MGDGNAGSAYVLYRQPGERVHLLSVLRCEMATPTVQSIEPENVIRQSGPTRRDIIVLLAMIAIACAGIELGTMIFLGHVSRIQKRFASERKTALAAGTTETRPSVLLVGNSLLEQGIDPNQLQEELGKSVAISRYAVSNTNYFDWYFGLRRLFREGAKPDVVVVMLNARQLMSRSISGDYAVQTMMDTRDVWELANGLGSSNTELSALYADRASVFYGSRGEIRNWILHAVFPPFEEIRSSLKPSNPPLPSDQEIAANVQPRLEKMSNVCHEHGATMVLLMPAALAQDGSGGVRKAVDLLGIRVLAPFSPGELPSELFSDGFHLNAAGAKRYTTRVAELLGADVAKIEGSSHLSVPTVQSQVAER